jgi:hypothetical protein
MPMFDRIRAALLDKQRKAWERKRRDGRRSFIFRRGVLKWGGTMFVLTACGHVMLGHQPLGWLQDVSLLIACLLLGYVWGFFSWFLNEKRFGFEEPKS